MRPAPELASECKSFVEISERFDVLVVPEAPVGEDEVARARVLQQVVVERDLSACLRSAYASSLCLRLMSDAALARSAMASAARVGARFGDVEREFRALGSTLEVAAVPESEREARRDEREVLVGLVLGHDVKRTLHPRHGLVARPVKSRPPELPGYPGSRVRVSLPS